MKTNYIEAPRLQKNDMPQRHNKERNKQSSNQKIPIETSNQRIPIELTKPTILRATWKRYYDKSKEVFYRN